MTPLAANPQTRPAAIRYILRSKPAAKGAGPKCTLTTILTTTRTLIASHSRRDFFGTLAKRTLAGAGLLELGHYRAAWFRAMAATADTQLFDIEQAAPGVFFACARAQAHGQRQRRDLRQFKRRAGGRFAFQALGRRLADRADQEGSNAQSRCATS